MTLTLVAGNCCCRRIKTLLHFVFTQADISISALYHHVGCEHGAARGWHGQASKWKHLSSKTLNININNIVYLYLYFLSVQWAVSEFMLVAAGSPETLQNEYLGSVTFSPSLTQSTTSITKQHTLQQNNSAIIHLWPFCICTNGSWQPYTHIQQGKKPSAVVVWGREWETV